MSILRHIMAVSAFLVMASSYVKLGDSQNLTSLAQPQTATAETKGFFPQKRPIAPSQAPQDALSRKGVTQPALITGKQKVSADPGLSPLLPTGLAPSEVFKPTTSSGQDTAALSSLYLMSSSRDKGNSAELFKRFPDASRTLAFLASRTPQQRSTIRVKSAEESPSLSATGEVSIAQTTPSSTPQTSTSSAPAKIPEYLNPNPNPLLFPTTSDEVQVQTLQPISLQQALELARRNNRELQVAVQTLDRSRAGLREQLASEFPTVSLSTDFTRTESASSDLRGQSGNPMLDQLLGNDRISTSLNSSIELSYDFYTSGRRRAGIRSAEEQLRFDQLDVERQSEQLRLDVTNAYYDLQEADAQLGIADASVRDAIQSLRDAELRERAGLGTRFDVLQAQVALANANQDRTLAISQQSIARRRLVQLLSLSQAVEVSAADPIQPAGDWTYSLEQSIVLALKNRAELEQQLAQRNLSEQQRRIALAATSPQASLFANYNILEQFADEQGTGDGFSLGARLRWDLFDGGAARARGDQQKANINIAETQFASQRNQIRFEVEQAFSNLNSNRENIQTAEFALTQAEESLRLARLRFDAGVGTQTDVINQQTELTRARVNQLRAVLDYNRALASLQRAISNLPDSQLADTP